MLDVETLGFPVGLDQNSVPFDGEDLADDFLTLGSQNLHDLSRPSSEDPAHKEKRACER
jgi:hypothetical protein